MHQDGQLPTRRAPRRRDDLAPPDEPRESPLGDAAKRRKRRSAEDRRRKRQRKAEDLLRRQARKAEDQEVRKLRGAEDREVRTERKAEGLLLKAQRRAERLHRRELRRAAKLDRQEQIALKRAERAERRELERAEEAAKRLELQELRRAKEALEAEERKARQAEQEELRRIRQAQEEEQRRIRQAEQEEQRRLREAAKREEAEKRRAEKAAQRARHATAVEEARKADASARELLKQAKADAHRVRQLRKAEDAELRKLRKAEDAERHRAIAADSRVRVRRKRRWTMWLALGMLAAGLSLAGYIGWQLVGTNWVSHRKQERIVEQVREEWTVAAATTMTESGPPTVQVDEGEVSGLIRIPEFGKDYVVPVLEGTSDEVLAAGFGHFTSSSDPGELGNYALAAHRVTHGEPLRDMPSLEVGDKVIVETRYATYTYVLTSAGDALRVSFRDIWVIDYLPTNPDPDGVQPAQVSGQRLLTLTTCAELFHTDDRLIAFGVLKDTKLKR